MRRYRQHWISHRAVKPASIGSVAVLLTGLTGWFGVYPAIQDLMDSYGRYQLLQERVCALERADRWLFEDLHKQPHGVAQPQPGRC